MKITTKKLSDTKVEITVKLDAEDLKIARKKAVERLARDTKVPGFRKGKAPAKEAEKFMSANAISEHTLDIAVRTTVPKAFDEAKESPLMVPDINVTKYVPEEEVEYTAIADVLPEIKLGDFKKLKTKKPEVKVSEKDINDIIDNIRQAYAEKKPVKRAAKMGDEVIIDFEGSKDGVKFDGGSAKGHKLTLGSKSFIPGFEEGVVGHEPGDRFDLELTFPKDYHNGDLAGAKTNFNVLLKQVNEVILPEVDDELAKKCGPFKTAKELKAYIKKNLTAQSEHRATEKLKDDLVMELVSASKVSAPEILIKDQLRFIRDDITRNAQAHNMTFDDYLRQAGQTEEEWEKEARKIAEIRVKSSLCLQILARDQKIEASDKDVDAKLAELNDVYQKSPDALKQLDSPAVRQDIKNRLTIEKTLDFLVKNAK